MKCKIEGCSRTDIKNKKEGLCSIHYARWYRKIYPERIVPTRRANYIRNREARLKGVKDWNKRHPDYNKNRMKKRYVEEYELNLIRQKTKNAFSHLKVACIRCGIKSQKLEFHHLEPYAYDNFEILCQNCHRKAHGRLLAEMEEKNNNDN